MGGYNNHKSITVYVVIFSMFFTLNQQRCLGQDLKKCIDKVKYAGEAINRGEFSLARQYREECCSALTPVVDSGETMAAELICDAVMKEFEIVDKEEARVTYENMISYCGSAVSLKGLFESTKCYKELPEEATEELTIELDTTCSEIIKDRSSSSAKIDTCCNGLRQKVIGSPYKKDEIANALCDAVDTLTESDDDDEESYYKAANQAFKIIASKCLSDLSLNIKSTHCNLVASQ